MAAITSRASNSVNCFAVRTQRDAWGAWLGCPVVTNSYQLILLALPDNSFPLVRQNTPVGAKSSNVLT